MGCLHQVGVLYNTDLLANSFEVCIFDFLVILALVKMDSVRGTE